MVAAAARHVPFRSRRTCDGQHVNRARCASCAGYKGASDLFIDSNIQLALAAARQVRKGEDARGVGATRVARTGQLALDTALSCPLTRSWPSQAGACTC